MVLQQASHRANQFSRSRSLRRYSLRDCAYSSMTFRRSSISDAARGCFAASLALSSGGFGFVIIQEGWGSRAALDLYQGADARFYLGACSDFMMFAITGTGLEFERHGTSADRANRPISRVRHALPLPLGALRLSLG